MPGSGSKRGDLSLSSRLSQNRPTCCCVLGYGINSIIVFVARC